MTIKQKALALLAEHNLRYELLYEPADLGQERKIEVFLPFLSEEGEDASYICFDWADVYDRIKDLFPTKGE